MTLIIVNEHFNSVILLFNLKLGGYGNYKTIFKN